MKEKKTLLKEIYVRIYDKKLVDKYEEVKNSKREKVTDNDFAQELIKLGLSVLTSSKEGLENFVDSSAEMKRMLGVIIKELRKQSDNNSVISEINNKKSNAIYNLLVAQATGETVTESEIENGMYDAMPERFVEEIRKKGDRNEE